MKLLSLLFKRGFFIRYAGKKRIFQGTIKNPKSTSKKGIFISITIHAVIRVKHTIVLNRKNKWNYFEYFF